MASNSGGDAARHPLYDGDDGAANGIPEAVSALKERIVASDGVLLVTPGIQQRRAGVFKNAIDWLSRPANDIARACSAGGRSPWSAPRRAVSARSCRRTTGCRC